MYFCLNWLSYYVGFTKAWFLAPHCDLDRFIHGLHESDIYRILKLKKENNVLCAVIATKPHSAFLV